MSPIDAEKLNELRTYAHLAPHMLPLLEKRKKSAYGKLISNYHAGVELLGATAEIAVIHDIEREILGKLKELESYKIKEN